MSLETTRTSNSMPSSRARHGGHLPGAGVLPGVPAPEAFRDQDRGPGPGRPRLDQRVLGVVQVPESERVDGAVRRSAHAALRQDVVDSGAAGRAVVGAAGDVPCEWAVDTAPRRPRGRLGVEPGRSRVVIARVVQCVLGELDQRAAIEDLGEDLLSRRRKLPAPDHRGHDRAGARGRRRVLGQGTGGGRRNRRAQVGP